MCSERRTPNVTRWLLPDTMLLPISPIPPFPLVVHRSHISRFTVGGNTAWEKARLWAKRLSWQPQGGQVK